MREVLKKHLHGASTSSNTHFSRLMNLDQELARRAREVRGGRWNRDVERLALRCFAFPDNAGSDGYAADER